MKFNENLQELYLARNHLVPEDGQHLGSILRTNKTLRVLDVSDNNLQVCVALSGLSGYSLATLLCVD